MLKIRSKVKRYSSPEQVISELWDLTCHLSSHCVTFYPTQVNTPRLNPSQTGRYLIYSVYKRQCGNQESNKTSAVWGVLIVNPGLFINIAIGIILSSVCLSVCDTVYCS